MLTGKWLQRRTSTRRWRAQRGACSCSRRRRRPVQAWTPQEETWISCSLCPCWRKAQLRATDLGFYAMDLVAQETPDIHAAAIAGSRPPRPAGSRRRGRAAQRPMRPPPPPCRRHTGHLSRSRDSAPRRRFPDHLCTTADGQTKGTKGSHN